MMIKLFPRFGKEGGAGEGGEREGRILYHILGGRSPKLTRADLTVAHGAK